MVTANEVNKLVHDMRRESNASPAVVYVCAALLLGLYVSVQFAGRDPDATQRVAAGASIQASNTYVEEHY